MSIYSNLPVYRTSYELLLNLFKFSNNFSRDYKYTLGESIKKEVVELLSNIYFSNKETSNRKIRILQAQKNTETIRLYLRLLKDLKQINLKKFIVLNEEIESVSKQLTAWYKSCK
ncbi:MAG: four helix bundle protein [Patescibacteria group bacterium]|nr:four helix bundle protein [Patescibacteria group bacterium]